MTSVVVHKDDGQAPVFAVCAVRLVPGHAILAVVDMRTQLNAGHSAGSARFTTSPQRHPAFECSSTIANGYAALLQQRP